MKHSRRLTCLFLIGCLASVGFSQIGFAQNFRGNEISLRLKKRMNHRGSYEVLDAFEDVVKQARRATVELQHDDDLIAMGGVVSPSGLIVTKASLLSSYLGEPIEVKLSDGRRYPLQEVLVTDRDNDLALCQIEATGLTPMEIASKIPSQVGTIVATTGTKETPVSIGVYSLKPHKVENRKAMLGVMLAREPGPAMVESVLEQSAAATAGILSDDVILSINDLAIRTGSHLVETVQGFQPGETLNVKLKRDAEEISVKVILKEWAAGHQARHEFQNQLGGKLSNRRSGFASVFQHDSFIRPEECGGPVVNLDGQVIGLNIARAGRVATYAISGDELQTAVGRLISSAKTVPSQITAKPVLSEQVLRNDNRVTIPEWKSR